MAFVDQSFPSMLDAKGKRIIYPIRRKRPGQREGSLVELKEFSRWIEMGNEQLFHEARHMSVCVCLVES